MARYRVAGGTGNWSSTTNWSATSGGASGAAVPTSADDVFVNALSGTSPIITVDTTSNCLSLDFTGAITPTLAGTPALDLYGSLILISAMTRTFTGPITFKSTSTGKTITTAGKSMSSNFDFNGVGGGWTLQDDLTTGGGVTLYNGTLNFNGKTITLGSFQVNVGTKSLILGASTINCPNAFQIASATGLTLDAGTSTINMTASGYTFTGGGFTYYILNILSFTSIASSNTFRTLAVSAGGELELTSGTTQTFTNLTALGTLGNVISIHSKTPGSAATISRNGGVVTFNYCSIKDITATGGATFNAYNSTNVSGNTGINFLGGSPPVGYAHHVMGQTISKVSGVTPSKVNGV